MIGRTAVMLAALAVTGCGTEPPPVEDAPPVAGTNAVTSGLGAARNFMETWNTRDPAVWASSLNYPHARPSAAGGRVWATEDDYIATVDYARVVATGWDRTVFEDLRVVHEGEDKAHVAGRWARLDAAGETIRRNLVTYIATEVDGHWGIQARFGAGAPILEERREAIAAIAVGKVEEYMAAFNARDPVAWAATLNYPHLRIASSAVRVWDAEEAFAAGMDFEAFAERFGWHRSGWDEIEAVQVAENGVNVALTVSRYNADDEVISTFNTLYLVTNDNGRWGIRARSSFTP